MLRWCLVYLVVISCFSLVTLAETTQPDGTREDRKKDLKTFDGDIADKAEILHLPDREIKDPPAHPVRVVINNDGRSKRKIRENRLKTGGKYLFNESLRKNNNLNVKTPPDADNLQRKKKIPTAVDMRQKGQNGEKADVRFRFKSHEIIAPESLRDNGLIDMERAPLKHAQFETANKQKDLGNEPARELNTQLQPDQYQRQKLKALAKDTGVITQDDNRERANFEHKQNAINYKLPVQTQSPHNVNEPVDKVLLNSIKEVMEKSKQDLIMSKSVDSGVQRRIYKHNIINQRRSNVEKLPMDPNMSLLYTNVTGLKDRPNAKNVPPVNRLENIPVIKTGESGLSNSYTDGYVISRLSRQNDKFRKSHKIPVNKKERKLTNIKVPPVQFDGTDFSINLSNLGYVEFKIRRAPKASTGQPWPLPQYYKVRENRIYTIDARNFRFNLLTPTSCDVLPEALKRYHLIITEFTIFDMHDNLEHARGQGVENEESKYSTPLYTNATALPYVDIKVRVPCNLSYPPVDMDETYNILIMDGKAVITANEVWGMLRGLETFSQLVFRGSDNKLYIREVSINDYPRFQHRGILFDTSRHFMFKETIFDVLEAMAANKMNVFHWHIVDDQSFPYQSKVFPKLSEKGAFHPDMVYTHKDIKEIIQFARMRGIRVMPEFDTPGHTYSWGLGYPELLTQCYEGNTLDINNLGPLNPILNSTYKFLHDLLQEVSSVFPDQWMHLGGDEVPLSCWNSNTDLNKFLDKLINGQQENMESLDIQQLMKYYETRLLQEFNKIQKHRKVKQRPVFWQEVMDNVDNLPSEAIIHVWKGGVSDIQRAVRVGHDVIYSTCWYLDWISYGAKWDKYYTCDPTTEPFEKLSSDNKVLGGEAAIWAEYIDNEQLMAYLWPRASATAERLWSNKNVRSVHDASIRLQEQRCRMLGRGLSVSQISGPDYCPSRGPRKHRSASSLWAEVIRRRDQEHNESSGNLKAAVRIPLGVESREADIVRTPEHRSIDLTWTLLPLVLIIIAAVIISRSRSVSQLTSRSHLWRRKSFWALLVTLVYLTSFMTIWLTAAATNIQITGAR